MTDQSPVGPVGDPEPAQAVKPAPLPSPVAAKSETEYVVLAKDADKDWWIEIGRQTATAADGAIRAALSGTDNGGTYLAVPARSWKPVKVSTKVTKSLVIEEAS